MKKYVIRVGDALSQLLNVAFFFGDNANESVSGRSYRNRRKRFWGVMQRGIDGFFALFGQAEHCRKAYCADVERALRTTQETW